VNKAHKVPDSTDKQKRKKKKKTQNRVRGLEQFCPVRHFSIFKMMEKCPTPMLSKKNKTIEMEMTPPG
jgi:hypothetical protein